MAEDTPVSASPANVTVPTLEEVAAALGPPSPQLVSALLPDSARQKFIEDGTSIRSAKVLVDLRRGYGLVHAFTVKATPEQMKRLRGFSLPLFAVAVERAVALGTTTAETSSAVEADATARAVAEKVLAEAMQDGMAARDQAATALTTVAGMDDARLVAVQRAKGTAGDAEELAKGLEALAAIAQDFATSEDETIATVAEATQVDEDYAKELKDLATRVKDAGTAAGGRLVVKKVTQADMDLLDGQNMKLYRDIVFAFDRAHAIDPSIPRLVPTNLRRFLGRRSRAKKAMAEASGAPTESAGASTSE